MTLRMRACLVPGFLFISVLSTAVFAGQSCRGQEPGHVFETRDDGIAIDKQSGLMWMRCAFGQRWHAGRCERQAEIFTWNEARVEISRFNADGGVFGFNDWRLPTITELQSIVVPGCEEPALDTAVFPDAPITAYWSSTPDPDYEPGVMLVHFVNGRIYMGNRAVHWAMRLVR